jgi:Spy/CpxP family protein refolding chaperone
MKFGPLILPVILAGVMSAQTAPPAQAQGQHNHSQNNRPQKMMQKLTADLNLTADQQAKAKQIFHQSWEQRKALTPKLTEERSAVVNAIKTDNPAQIDRVIQQNEQVNAQAAEIHAKAMAKFYAILTPDQKAKMDQKMDHRMHRMEHAGQASSRG